MYVNEPRWINILQTNEGDSLEIAAILILNIAPHRSRIDFIPLSSPPPPPLQTIRCKLDSHHLFAFNMDAYFALEACCDHPYAFSSFVYGHPVLLTVDGCTKVVTCRVSLKQFSFSRADRTLYADLQQQLLAFSIMASQNGNILASIVAACFDNG